MYTDSNVYTTGMVSAAPHTYWGKNMLCVWMMFWSTGVWCSFPGSWGRNTSLHPNPRHSLILPSLYFKTPSSLPLTHSPSLSPSSLLAFIIFLPSLSLTFLSLLPAAGTPTTFFFDKYIEADQGRNLSCSVAIKNTSPAGGVSGCFCPLPPCAGVNHPSHSSPAGGVSASFCPTFIQVWTLEATGARHGARGRAATRWETYRSSGRGVPQGSHPMLSGTYPTVP